MTEWQANIRTAADPVLWNRLARRLEEDLQEDIRQPGLIEGFYLPIFFHLHDAARRQTEGPLVAGINAPQGGGKSTLTSYLVRLFECTGMRAVSLSIDDFYLTRTAQRRLARANADNPYLQQRGYPGTHDIDLGAETLSRLITRGAGDMRLPAYDKSAHNGQGDRAGEARWQRVRLPVDVVLFEGWMLGFQPLPAGQIDDPGLARVNELLAAYRVWHERLDTFIYLFPADPAWVVDWRSEAEARMKAAGRPGMSAEEVRAYAEKFLPAYRLYGPRLLESPPVPGSSLRIEIGRNRLPANLA